ncbi:glycerate kinase [Pseudoalteromonas sp. NBT06-2]|uniref:glycerate kinase type-2 family protein n=1 Tax=Pseudoalteromonas sp. NBT06-2 TaxID=2025950 RepID=UPI000BA59BFD|nr:glycerate kinase [Pseudoalteromonas sp. NBT06-2]PAJ75024.1 glycerate kinase [Pseudoalteromonas sp. NBT06-2]
MISNPEAFLIDLFHTAINAAHPKVVLAKYLPKNTNKRAVVIGAGKAAASMAQALEQHWQGPLSGLVVTRYGHNETCKHIEVVEAAHPIPDDAGQAVAKRIMQLVDGLTKDDIVVCLLSGGGSSLLSLPPEGINLSDKQAINKSLLKSGAAIDEINCVRKHLSAIKGGRLAKACFPATVHTYAISDVPSDEATVIASGPTVADPTTSIQALSILESYHIQIPNNVRNWLKSPESETLKQGDPALENTHFTLIATPKDALDAAQTQAEKAGIKSLILGDKIEGESKEVAKVHGAITLNIAVHGQPLSPPCVILSGGETTVAVKGSGRGGRNAEFLLSLAIFLQKQQHFYVIAADTDGIDGSEDNAGCLLTPQTYKNAKLKQLNLQSYLDNNDGYGFFEATEQLIKTGATRTNVNDFRAILIL